MTRWLTWREAMEQALYGEDGFYRRTGGGPAAHFRTSAHSPLFGEALARLLVLVDRALGSPERLDFVDVGAGRGELIASVTTALGRSAPEVAARVRVTAVEVADRPQSLPPEVEWSAEIPEGVVGLLIANEWLDNVIFDVAEVAEDGSVRVVEVDTATGEERPGPMPSAAQSAWLARWWPLAGREPGTRAEIGLDRDQAWSRAVSRIERGLAVAVDYAHVAGERPEYGTMTGYRDGHQVEPVPDGSCDVTAHVALDACAGADTRVPTAASLDNGSARAAAAELVSQREVLHRLGINGSRPPLELARTDPSAYIRALSNASSAAELTDPSGLGRFTWLIQQVGGGFEGGSEAVFAPLGFGPVRPD